MVDYLIVGQGIAGTWLSYFLKKAGKSVKVFDPLGSNASRVASGIINPITGRRFVKTWLADELIPFARTMYREIQEQLGEEFLREMNMYKLFTSVLDQNEWSTKVDNGNYGDYLARNEIVQLDESLFHNPFGAFEIANCLVMDGNRLLDGWRAHLQDEGDLEHRRISTDGLVISGEDIRFGSLQSRNVIFCDGFHSLHNPLFSWLPFVVTKGEALIIDAGGLEIEYVLNGQVTLLPLGDNKFYVGATQEWKSTSPNPTEKMRERLENGLRSIYGGTYEVIDHLVE